MTTIEHDLMTLHDFYVEAVNLAVSQDDYLRVDRLAAEYDAEALLLMHRATELGQRAA